MSHTFSSLQLGRPFALLACWLLATFVVGQLLAKADAGADATLVEPFVSDTTFLILKVEPELLNVPKLDENLPPETVARYRAFAEQIAAQKEQLTALLDGSPIYGTAGIQISRTRLPFQLVVPRKSEQHAVKLIEFAHQLGHFTAEDRNGLVVARTSERALPRSSPHSHEVIAAAFQAIADHPAKLLIIPPAYLWRTVRELSPHLPTQLGGRPSSVLTEGVQWVAIGFDSARSRIEVVVQSASPDAAQTFATALPEMLQLAHAAAPENFRKRTAGLAHPVISSLKPTVEGDQVKVVIDGAAEMRKLQFIAAIAQAAGRHRQRADDQQRLRRVLLAMHNYHEVHRALPPAQKHRDENGKPLLSWRVHILPFIDEKELYDQFHLDEPWDSEHNAKLLEKMPDVYASATPAVGQDALPAGRTTLVAPVGKGTIFGQSKPTKIQHIVDGTSNTVAALIVAPERAVPWTAPQDFQFDANDPLQGVHLADDAWHAALADGSTHALPAAIHGETVLRLFQMNDGNPVNIPRR